jgi:hypothetical protein
LLGFVSSKSDPGHLSLVVALPSIAGITMGYLWYRIIRSYKGLNSGKFKVVHAIEQRLPLALYDTEWEMLGQGTNRSLYWPFTHIELLVPWIFIIIYSLLTALALPWSGLLRAICT